MMGKAQILVAGALVLVTVSACSSGASSDASSPAAPAAGASASGSAAPATDGAIGSYKEAQQAVIQIVADGEYIDPASGQTAQESGAGSGFIIDPSGIAVTNAHVVEGAGSIKVFVGGSTDSINAKILGVSECNDLAVIDLTGDGFPFLRWADGDAELGTEVWAAGFPLGEPQYTLVDGTIAKNNADGNTSWASLDYALQDTAEIQPGNSGGPLIAGDASVVGVNYMSNNSTNQAQFFAIPAAVAKPVVEVLRTGEDQDSIGVNGEAFYDEQNSLAGLWVSGVRSGSPASNAGVVAGDVILKLEGRDVVLAKDLTSAGPTKSGYCDVLRTKGSDQPMKIQVYRPATGEVLEGEVNNDQKPLVAITTVSNGSGSQSSTESPSDTGTVSFTSVTDDSGAITVDVPDVWSTVGTADASISATADASGFADGTSPGVEYYVFDGKLSAKDLKSTMKALVTDPQLAAIIDSCEDSEAGTVTDGDGYQYIGNSYWTCQGTDISYYLSVRSYPGKSKFVILDGQFATDQEVELVNRSLASLVVN